MPQYVPFSRHGRRLVELRSRQGAPLDPEGVGGSKGSLVKPCKALGMGHEDVPLDDRQRVILLQLFGYEGAKTTFVSDDGATSNSEWTVSVTSSAKRGQEPQSSLQ